MKAKAIGFLILLVIAGIVSLVYSWKTEDNAPDYYKGFFSGFFGGFGLMSAPIIVNGLIGWADDTKQTQRIRTAIVVIGTLLFVGAWLYLVNNPIWDWNQNYAKASIAFWIGFGLMTTLIFFNKAIGRVDKILGAKGEIR
jgi:hypothetical protein